MKLLKPIEGFVVKTTIYKYGSNRTTRLPQKCFINMCKCDDVDKAISSSNDGRQGYWSIPHIVSAAKADQDKDGIVCTTFDALFHSDTIDRCFKNTLFQEMCVNIALETIQKHHKNSGDSLSKDWKLLKNLKCKGVKPG